MNQLNLDELEMVSGGSVWKEITIAIISTGIYDLLKAGGAYAMANSHMGRGNFPPVPRAGHE